MSNDNVNTWDTKMTEPVKQTRSAFSSQLIHTNTTGNDTDDKMAGGMDGGKSLETAMSKPGGIQSSREQERAYYRKSEDGRWETIFFCLPGIGLQDLPRT